MSPFDPPPHRPGKHQEIKLNQEFSDVFRGFKRKHWEETVKVTILNLTILSIKWIIEQNVLLVKFVLSNLSTDIWYLSFEFCDNKEA